MASMETIMIRRGKTSMSDTLKTAIEKSDKSRYQISKDTGIAQSVLSRFMSGERGLSMEALERLFEYLGLEVVEKLKRRK